MNRGESKIYSDGISTVSMDEVTMLILNPFLLPLPYSACLKQHILLSDYIPNVLSKN